MDKKLSAPEIEQLELQLDSFDLSMRKSALVQLLKSETLPARCGDYVNIHIHTFFGYNVYGYSPCKAVWLARKHGLAVAGIIDFDVLDGLNEFIDAAKLTGIKAIAGLESRVFVPEFADKEINSPGEPGVAYHIGTGFPGIPAQKHLCDFLHGMQNMSQKRNIELIRRVNSYLDPVVVDYEKDVLPLTPKGNPTERHICQAYAIKSLKLFEDSEAICKFWMSKLECGTESIDLPHGPKLLGAIRKKTMKKGSIGYVVPDKDSFPAMADVNKFVIESGGIPTLCWHDGMSEGEQQEEKLIEAAMKSGVAAFSVIPNPVYTPRDPQKKLENMHKVIRLADDIGLPIVSGTEMNNYGQPFVDDFASKELAPFVPVLRKGAHIIYAHSVLERHAKAGYTSAWSAKNFNSRNDKNRFFEQVGILIDPEKEHKLSSLPNNPKPQDMLSALKKI